MSHSFGVCGIAGDRRLPPQAGRPVYHPCGRLSAQLAPTMWVKMQGEVPPSLFLGLLVSPPNPDGDRWFEADGPGYDRAPVRLQEQDWRLMSISNAVDLSAPQDAVVSHIGLFDPEGRLAFYGRLIGQHASTSPLSKLHFGAHSLKVLRV